MLLVVISISICHLSVICIVDMKTFGWSHSGRGCEGKREFFANNLRIWLALELDLPLTENLVQVLLFTLKDKWYFSASHYKQGQQINELRPPGLILKCEQTLFILAVSGSYVPSDLPCVHYYSSSKTCLSFFLPRSGFPLHIIPVSVTRSVSVSGWVKNNC